MKNLKNFPVKKKNVLLRVDLNVPVIDGVITDRSRLYIIKATVDKLRSNKNKIFLLSHFGRPKGKFSENLSMKFLTSVLEEVLLINKIYFLSRCFGNEVNATKNIMQPGDVCLLENVRFHKGEEQNNLNFARDLADSYNIYVNDAFSASHRQHASIVGVTNYLPSLAGISFINEIENLDKILFNTRKPTTAIIGGSKISTKLILLNNLIEISDNIIIGGAMAHTFLLAQGNNIGKSLVEKDLISDAISILEKSKKFNTNIILPIDFFCSTSIDDSNNIKKVDYKNILPDQMALDIGDKTIKLIKEVIMESNTVLWNGPLGVYEHKPFDYATNTIVDIIKQNAKISNITTIAGGGDTIAAIRKAKAEKDFTYISTAGGAFLQWLEGKESPGIKALKENDFS